MNALHLHVQAEAYQLSLDGQVLARLAGGAAALLAGSGARLREVDIEAAIERVEDWLMPASKRIRGLELSVHDHAGRLRDRLGSGASLAPEEVEAVFSGAVDEVVAGRPLSPHVVADVVLLRELAHHGALIGVRVA